MRRIDTRLDGPILLEPVVHGDARGFFLESYRANVWAEHGIDDVFVQDNHSRSARGVLRGMHFQPGMAKLLRCARGSVLDVLVDIRPGSASFGHWEGYEIDDERHHHLYVPDGFAHGFCVLSDVSDLVYKCSAYWDPAVERVFAYDDPEVGIEWPLPVEELIPSERDATAPTLSEIADELPFEYAALAR